MDSQSHARHEEKYGSPTDDEDVYDSDFDTIAGPAQSEGEEHHRFIDALSHANGGSTTSERGEHHRSNARPERDDHHRIHSERGEHYNNNVHSERRDHRSNI